MGSITVDASRASPSPYEIQAVGPSAPRFGRPSSSSRRDNSDGSPVKIARSPSKSVRYNNQRRVGELSDVLAMTTIAPSQKELAKLVALAAERVRNWCEEVEPWSWDGTFQLPSDEVARRDSRLEVIGDDLNELRVEDLKDHVLDIYIGRSRSGLTRSIENLARLPVNFLDTYELFVTQTLIQLLPQMVLLKQLLRSWSMRLLILRKSPAFLARLQSCREYLSTDFAESWDPVSPSSSPEHLRLLQSNIQNAQKRLRNLTQDAGRQLDAMLDTLEGSDDCLPDDWIDEYEKVEAEYTQWTVEANSWILQIEVAITKAIAKENEESERVKLGNLTPTAATSTQTEAPTFLDIDHSASESGSSASSFFSESAEAVSIRSSQELEGSARAAQYLVPLQLSMQEDLTLQLGYSAYPQTENAADRFGDTGSLPFQIHARGDMMRNADTEEAAMIRRASTTSINSFQKSQLKQVNVRRSSSLASSVTLPSRGSVKETSSAPVSPTSPAGSIRRQSWLTNPTSPLTVAMAGVSKDVVSAPATPVSPTIPENLDEGLESGSSADASVNQPVVERTPEYVSSPEESPYSQTQGGSSLENSPLVARQLSRVPRPVLNTMPKRKPVANAQLAPAVLSDDSSPPPVPPKAKRPSSPSKLRSQTVPRMPLQQQISAIISEIHAPIRLASTPPQPAIAAPDPPNPSANPSKFRRLPSLRTSLHRSTTPTATSSSPLPGLTLAPASSEDARRAGVSADPEMQLYHLHSGAGGAPIKLFVRRVGGGADDASPPRVMVRVGGGWADLREYLRAYAEHHHGSLARRAVSDGGVLVRGLGAAPADAAGASAPRRGGAASGAVSPSSSPSPLTVRDPEGPAVAFDGAAADRGMRGFSSAWSESGSSPVGPMGSSPSAPSSGRRHASRGEQRSLAGPVAAAAHRKGEMSEEKRDWVEGIVEQAKRLHIVGGKEKGTKRVFLKGKE